MNAIVTGSSGFIGTALVRRLVSDGWKVIGLDRRIPDECCSYEFRWGGLSVPPFLGAETCDVVFHLAATPGVMTSVSDPAGVYANNVSSTANALEMAKRYGVKRFVFASSSTVYGNGASEGKHPSIESDPLCPLNAYAASKVECERIVRDFSRYTGLESVILRPFSVYGPGMRPDLAMSKVADSIQKGTVFKMRGDGSSRRDYTYIDDVVDAFVLAANVPLSREIAIPTMTINVGAGNPVSLRDMISAVETAMGGRAHVERTAEESFDAPVTFADRRLAEGFLKWLPHVKFVDGIGRFANGR